MTVLDPQIFNVLAILGAAHLLPYVYRVLRFIWVYTLRPSSAENFLRGPATYALITGATDGIGKSTAQELYRRGFSLVLHGRNPDKTKAVMDEIKAMGGGDVQYFLADAAAPGHNFEELLAPFKKLNITIVFHNVGGTPLRPDRIDGWTEDEMFSIPRWNVLFALGLTRVLLPQLRASPGPTHVLASGSAAGEIPPPRLSMYSSSKTYLKGLMRALDVDERNFAPRSQVYFTYLPIGQVRTNAMQHDTHLLNPESDVFARSLVNKIGLRVRCLSPYWSHAMSQWFILAIGEWVGEAIVSQTMQASFKEVLDEKKSQ